MLNKLTKQLNGEDWSWNNLNTLGWAIGSISGSMAEEQETGQYPKFLGAHWKFLKIVVNKLFEFMHQSHPGVQDMACDTFLKIGQRCKRKFVIIQVGEHEPFVSELLTEPLWDSSTVSQTYPDNVMVVRDYTITLLSTAFPNMSISAVTLFVNSLFESRNDPATFKEHIRDFLVQSKGFSSQDNGNLYVEETTAQRERKRQRMLTIPGLIAPNEIQD
ncbi:hypothetical protein GIB67_034408 [Kingdonia uniflora]|uniref:Exportin-1 C-terminal domain-containing protein n=1 Tax=Kingdonia uniflora TaxID=39325 RepID=A0A7J7NS56_9MAGN|nr:hypothetical protein GIB67_034408 [Kingdonia uniflora]